LQVVDSPCPFCEIGRGVVDPDLVAFRATNVFVFPTLKQRPSNSGQVLVCPVSHERSLYGLPTGLRNELFEVAAAVMVAATRAFGAVGTTVLVNDNAPDQALEHLHVHVIPRFADDNLVIPNVDRVPAPRSLRLELALKLRKAME
jgi:histidine triad (HIT) family protein